MKKTVFTALLVGFTLLFSGQAFAELKIAVVDVQRLLAVSSAAQSLQKERETLRKSVGSELAAKEKTLRDMEPKLKALSEDSSKTDEFNKQRKDYEAKLLELRKFAQDKKQNIDGASRKALADLQNQITAVVQEISDKNGYDLVITNQNIITGHKSLDITDTVLAELNKKYPKASLTVKN